MLRLTGRLRLWRSRRWPGDCEGVGAEVRYVSFMVRQVHHERVGVAL